MGTVVSLGSINVDRIRHVPEPEIAALAEAYDWFPGRGQTVQRGKLPAEFPTEFDTVRHGGKGANQAVAAARAGADTGMLGKVGPDHGEFGVLDRLGDPGVDTARIGRAAEPTGTAYVFVGPAGDNWIVVRPGANGAIDADYVGEQYDAILSADCLLLQNEIPVASVLSLLSDLAAEPGRPTVILDPAPAEGIEALLDCDAVDYLTPNETEFRALEAHLGGFDGVLVRTQGASDIVVETADRFTVTPPSVRAVDTTGAGDVLNGFVAARLAAGASVSEAVETGAIAAALAIREEGARRGIPTLEDVRSFRT